MVNQSDQQDPFIDQWNDSLKGNFLWTNSNFGEAMPDVISPLSWSLLEFGALPDWIHFNSQRCYGNIAGRIYFNISVLATVLRVMGRNRRQIMDMIAGALHSNLPDGMEIPTLPASKSAIFQVLPMLVRNEIRQRKDLRALPGLIAANPLWCRQVNKSIRGTQSQAWLASLWHKEIRHQTRQVWRGVLSSANYYTMFTNELYQKLVPIAGADDASRLISGLNQPGKELASLGLVCGINDLAKNKMTRDEFIASYGHRGSNEFEVAALRIAEDPIWIETLLAENKTSQVDVNGLLEVQQAGYFAALERLNQQRPRQLKSYLRKIEQIPHRGRLREAARSELARVIALIRTWALRVAELRDLGESVFYLTIPETLALLDGNNTALTYVPDRQRTFNELAGLPPYPAVINGRFDPFKWAVDPNRRSDIFDGNSEVIEGRNGTLMDRVIRGAPGSAGRIEGLVRRLDSPAEASQLQKGDILVTALTNVHWTPLFPSLGAVVTDVGAPLSHAAVVARELGIPAVVGCGDATARLKTGDRVRVDGGSGIVEILM